MRLPRIFIFAAFVAISAQASELPDLGEAARATVSLTEENQVGREVMREIRSDKDFLDDPDINEYLSALGERLVASSSAPYRQIDFFVVQDPMINAFALPGGHIGINSGLLSATRTESELAGVLSHEIGHVVQNHMARSVMGQKASMVAALAGMAVAILASHSDNPQISEAALATSQAYAAQNQLTDIQSHEKEADRVGLQTMASAGFDPNGMVSFFKHLMSQDRLYESNVPGFLRTHPMTYDRMADLQNRVAEMKAKRHVDSPEFALIRARVQASEGEAQDAYKRFSVLAPTQDDPAAWYGLALSALRVGNKEQADQALSHLEKEQHSALVESLDAQVLLGTGRVDQAVARLNAAIAHYPGYKPLAYAYARALLRQGNPGKARTFVSDRLSLWPEDHTLYQLLAEANHALGRNAEEHLAQAEAYIRLDQQPQAIEQLQLAQRSGDGDFYTQSVIDARLRDLKEQEAREKKSPESK
ncbi:MAG: M48 family metalloprotease [Parasulfuritortus sp.]|nr:M48 family metalloprotease [Parasulfuritortus sp.]